MLGSSLLELDPNFGTKFWMESSELRERGKLLYLGGGGG